MHMSMHMSLHMSICMSLHMSINMSIHISIHMSMHISIHMSLHISIHMSMHMSIHMSLHTQVGILVGCCLKELETLSALMGHLGEVCTDMCSDMCVNRVICKTGDMCVTEIGFIEHKAKHIIDIRVASQSGWPWEGDKEAEH